ncbi:hypothetical protein [Streptomyces chartreusis]
MRTRFEDRLLDELKAEIQLRQAEAYASGTAESALDGPGSKAPVRRLLTSLTPRRIGVIAAACTAAWLAAVVVPGSPADSAAYAVERHSDGSVTLTVKEQTISVAAQRDLARQVRPWGIHVTVDVLDPGYVCVRSWVPVPIAGVDKQGNRVPIIPIKASYDFTLRRGNVLAFENTKGATRPRAVELYATQSEAEPCIPMKLIRPGE